MTKLCTKIEAKIRYILNKSIFLYLRKSVWIWPKYRIGKCVTFNHGDLVEMKKPCAFRGSMQVVYNELLKTIENKLKNKEPLSIIRCGDGEAYFLQEKYIGNIIKRHFTNVDTTRINTNKWLDHFNNNDLKAFDINWYLRKLWIPFEGKRIKKKYYPLHAVYSLIATKDIFQVMKGYRIGIIGAKSKLDIIRELMKYEEYHKYLGIDMIHDYISIPETGACNDIEKLTSEILEQCISNRCDIYLLGTGISKLYFQSQIRDILKCIIIDVGSGIDAIAGVIPKDRQNFGHWINYKLKNYSYDQIDILSHHHLKLKSIHRIKKDVIL